MAFAAPSITLLIRRSYRAGKGYISGSDMIYDPIFVKPAQGNTVICTSIIMEPNRNRYSCLLIVIGVLHLVYIGLQCVSPP